MGTIGNQLALLAEQRRMPRDERTRVTTRKLGSEALRPPARPRVAMKPLDKPKR